MCPALESNRSIIHTKDMCYHYHQLGERLIQRIADPIRNFTQ